MGKKYKKAVFMFRRDLRLQDNLGLLAALEAADTVIPLFNFDPRQINREQNEYFTEPGFYFLLNSLQELSDDLKKRDRKLFLTEAKAHETVSNLIANDAVDAVFVNRDYTPFSLERDEKIKQICEKNNVAFHSCHDIALAEIEDIRTNQGKVYMVFTPFMKKAMEQPVPEPRRNNFDNYYSGNLKTATVKLSDYQADVSRYNLPVRGGRDEALKMLRENDYLTNYADTRNLPAIDGTSKLSAHHKYGTISIRETYHMTKQARGSHTNFVSELYWRDFYLYISFHFPKVFKESFLEWATNIKWENDQEQFTAWCEGKTGVPMVDAGMRELNNTGWMHNRSRMIVASYLTKNLLIDWRWGEKYFAKHLVDYDPSQNNGGWQWSASTGADPRPIRIFNPFTQAQKYDPDAVYIKKWIPELAAVEDSKLTNGKVRDYNELAPKYPSPLVDQTETFHRAMKTYKKAKK